MSLGGKEEALLMDQSFRVKSLLGNLLPSVSHWAAIFSPSGN